MPGHERSPPVYSSHSHRTLRRMAISAHPPNDLQEVGRFRTCRRCAEGPVRAPGYPLGRRGRPRERAPQRGQPACLLDSVSPYGSRRVIVEYDGATTSAYLHDKSGPIAATWIANHRNRRRDRRPGQDAFWRRAGDACRPHQASGRAASDRGRLADSGLARGRRRRRHPGRRRAAGRAYPAGRTWPRACPATAATSSARRRSAGHSMTRWRA